MTKHDQPDTSSYVSKSSMIKVLKQGMTLKNVFWCATGFFIASMAYLASELLWYFLIILLLLGCAEHFFKDRSWLTAVLIGFGFVIMKFANEFIIEYLAIGPVALLFMTFGSMLPLLTFKAWADHLLETRQLNPEQNVPKEYVGIFVGAIYVITFLCISLAATQILFGASALGWTLMIVLLTIVGFEISKGRLRVGFLKKTHASGKSLGGMLGGWGLGLLVGLIWGYIFIENINSHLQLIIILVSLFTPFIAICGDILMTTLRRVLKGSVASEPLSFEGFLFDYMGYFVFSAPLVLYVFIVFSDPVL